MKDYLKLLFSESEQASMMRVLSLLVVIASIILAFIGKDNTLVLGMLSIAFGSKLFQKTKE